MSQNFNELKEKIEEYHIRNIISIDDDWDKSNPMEENLEEYLKDNNYWDDKYEDLFDDIKSLNGNKTITVEDFILDKYPKLEEIKEATSSLFEDSIDTFLLPILKLASKLELNLIKLKSFQELKANGNFENSLVFIDKELLGPGSDEITNIMNLIQKNNNDKLNIFIVYSHTDLEELENHETKITYLANKFKEVEGIEEISGEDYFVIYKNIYLLHGFKKDHDFETFTQNTLNKFKIAVYGKSLQNIFDAKKQVEYETYKDIYSRPIENYSLLFEDAYFEGESPIDVIKKLVKNTKKDKSQVLWNSHLKKYENFSKEMAKIFLTNPTPNEESFKENKIKLVLSNDKTSNTIFNKSINSYYSDVTKGDLFCLNEKNYGIIISKECDCILRNNNGMINRKNEKFQLLMLKHEEIQDFLNLPNYLEIEKNMIDSCKTKYNLIDSKAKAKLQKEDPHYQSMLSDINKIKGKIGNLKKNFNETIWPVNIENRIYSFTSSNNILDIDSEILDLCSLNSDGKANLNFNNNYKSFKSHFSNKYFNDFVTNKFENENTSIDNYLMSNATNLTKNMLVYSIRNNISLVEDSINKKIIGFNIKRIGRLQGQRTLYLLQNYISHFTKPGFNTTTSFN